MKIIYIMINNNTKALMSLRGCVNLSTVLPN